MDEKKSIKVSLGTVVCIFIIFILIIALIWMYVHYNYISDNNNTSNIEDTVNTNNIITNTESSNNQAIAKSLDIDSQEVKRLYKYILKFNYYHETLVYQENKVTYNNIDNQLKLLTIFDNLDENQAQKVKTDDYTCVVEDDGNSYKYLYTKETVEAKAKEIFGKMQQWYMKIVLHMIVIAGFMKMEFIHVLVMQVVAMFHGQVHEIYY